MHRLPRDALDRVLRFLCAPSRARFAATSAGEWEAYKDELLCEAFGRGRANDVKAQCALSMGRRGRIPRLVLTPKRHYCQRLRYFLREAMMLRGGLAVLNLREPHSNDTPMWIPSGRRETDVWYVLEYTRVLNVGERAQNLRGYDRLMPCDARNPTHAPAFEFLQGDGYVPALQGFVYTKTPVEIIAKPSPLNRMWHFTSQWGVVLHPLEHTASKTIDSMIDEDAQLVMDLMCLDRKNYDEIDAVTETLAETMHAWNSGLHWDEITQERLQQYSEEFMRVFGSECPTYICKWYMRYPAELVKQSAYSFSFVVDVIA
jgi:hypothetical protein